MVGTYSAADRTLEVVGDRARLLVFMESLRSDTSGFSIRWSLELVSWLEGLLEFNDDADVARPGWHAHFTFDADASELPTTPDGEVIAELVLCGPTPDAD